MNNLQKVAVIHSSLNTVGGGERVCLGIIKALQQSNAQVHLFTTDKTEWELIAQKFGYDWLPNNSEIHEHHMIRKRLPLFGIYQRLAVSMFARQAVKKNDYDLVINTHGDIIAYDSDITYIHFPIHLLGGRNAIPSKYTSSPFWKLYFEPYRLMIKSSARSRINNTLLLFNSQWTRNICEAEWGLTNGKVIHPPVDHSKFAANTVTFEERQPSVLTISRLVPEKGLEMIPRIATRLGHITFRIVGGTSKYSRGTMLKLIRQASYLPNCQIFADLPIGFLQNIVNNSRAYLHTMHNEHFGIAPVEAMHAGLPLIVHKSGGTYTDITDNGKYGMAYETEDEAIDLIENAVTSPSIWRYYHNASRERASAFTLDKFMQEFNNVFTDAASLRQQKATLAPKHI